MKNIVRIMLLTIVFMMLFTAQAYANSARPSPYDIDIAIEDDKTIEKVVLFASEDGVQFVEMDQEEYLTETRKNNEFIARFHSDEVYPYFKIAVDYADGSYEESESVNFTEWGDYRYDPESKSLTLWEITSWRLSGMDYILYPIILVFPLIITIMVEMFIAKAFQLSKTGMVGIINLFTNLIMNLFITVLFNEVYLNYALVLLICEVLVMVVEFGFYLWRFKGAYTVKRLALFTLTANLASWAVYYAISFWMY